MPDKLTVRIQSSIFRRSIRCSWVISYVQEDNSTTDCELQALCVPYSGLSQGLRPGGGELPHWLHSDGLRLFVGGIVVLVSQPEDMPAVGAVFSFNSGVIDGMVAIGANAIVVESFDVCHMYLSFFVRCCCEFFDEARMSQPTEGFLFDHPDHSFCPTQVLSYGLEGICSA